MSNTENLGLKIPTLAEKNIHTTYVNNNEIIDEAYGQYLEDKETAQENIAMIETPVAQSNHTAGSYFMLDNVLHKATSNIASGEDIVSGSNATPITIEQALSALNSSVSALQDSLNSNNLVRVNADDIGWTQINNLSSTSQLTHNGFYHVDACSNIVSDFTDYGTGDFMMLLLANNYVDGHVRYGTLIVASPRFARRIWLIRIWNSSFHSAQMLGT